MLKILLLRKSVRSLLTFRQIGKIFTSMKETFGYNFLFFSGDREAVIARQEFIQQLSLWDEEETTEEQSFRKVPLPGVWYIYIYISSFSTIIKYGSSTLYNIVRCT